MPAVLSMLLPVFGLSAALSAPIPIWGMFEAAVFNNRPYGNPFVQTELQTQFVAPSGQTYSFFGFYDGDGQGGQTGNVWKVRFQCLEPGTWIWTASFTDGAPGGSGSFECGGGILPGPLRVYEGNRRWLRRADGVPFWPRWLSLLDLLPSKEGVWQQDIDTFVVAKNYNMVTAAGTHAELHLRNRWNFREYETPLYYPWVKEAGSVVWDRPDLRAWHKLDRVLAYLQARKVYYYQFDGFFPNIPPNFPNDPVLEQRYIRYALARLGPQWNVVHNITFEYWEWMSETRLNRIGSYIENVDPLKTLLTVHDNKSNYDAFANESWLDLSNLQYEAGRAGTAGVANAYVLTNYRGKPVLATEMVWEGQYKLNSEQVRRGAWGIAMAGGFFMYGEHDILWNGIGPYGAGGAHPYLRILHDFVESLPFWTMDPRNDLVNGGRYCLAAPGQHYLVYTENGGTVTLDLRGAGGSFEGRWLNPRSGTITAAGTTSGGAIRSFTAPDANDWVLHLRSSGSVL